MHEKKRNAFLLCTDGFWELVTEKMMLSRLKKARSAEEWILGMQQDLLKNGISDQMDNYTALGVFIE